jgi:hypothetical protein
MESEICRIVEARLTASSAFNSLTLHPQTIERPDARTPGTRNLKVTGMKGFDLS